MLTNKRRRHSTPPVSVRGRVPGGDDVKEQDKLDEAARMAADLVQLASESLADDDWRLARYHAEYGDVLDRAGKHDLAEQSFAGSYEHRARTRGEKDRRTVDAIRRLIRSL